MKQEYAYFHSVTMLIEGIQKDKDIFQAFRERNTEAVSGGICNKILSQYSTIIMILSTMYSSKDHILEIMELLPDYCQSFSKVPYSRPLLSALLYIDPKKISKNLVPQVEAIMTRFEELRHIHN